MQIQTGSRALLLLFSLTQFSVSFSREATISFSLPSPALLDVIRFESTRPPTLFSVVACSQCLQSITIAANESLRASDRFIVAVDALR